MNSSNKDIPSSKRTLSSFFATPQGAIFLTCFIDLLGFGMVIPVISIYANRLGLTGYHRGLLISVYSLMQFIFLPIWGRLSDKVGRRPVIMLSVVGGALSFGLFGISSLFVTNHHPAELWLNVPVVILFCSRLVGGIMTANISAAQAYIADITPVDQRAKGMGLIGAAFGLGFIFGPAIGGILAKHGGVAAVGAAGFTLALINLAQIYFRLPESHPAGGRSNIHNEEQYSINVLLRSLAAPGFGLLLLLYLAANLGTVNLEATFVLLMNYHFGYDEQATGYIFVFVGMVGVVVQGFLIRRLTSRFSEKNLLRLGYIFLGAGLVLIPFMSSLASLLTVIGIFGVGSGISFPVINSLISKGAPASIRGSIFGITQSLGALARTAAPPIANAMLDSNFKMLNKFNTLPYITGGIFIFTALIMTVGVRTQFHHSQTAEAQ